VSVKFDEQLNDLAVVLKAARVGRGRTHREVADFVGSSAATISRIEGGSRCPSLRMLMRLSRAYDLPLSTVFRALEAREEERRRDRV